MDTLSTHHERIESPDFRADILDIVNAQTFNLAPTEKDIDLMVDNLNEVFSKYGDPSVPTFLPYHNHIHTLDVVRRTATIGAIHHACAPERVSPRTITLAMIGASGHDIEQQTTNTQQTDEEVSAGLIRERMLERNYLPIEATRVHGGIIATTAAHDDNHIRQTHVRQGNPDPLKLILAMADIQAMTMEGDSRILLDVPKLYFEHTPPASATVHEHAIGLGKFLLSQYSFVCDRLDSLPGDLAYYYDEPTTKCIAERNRKEFRTHSLSAIRSAKYIIEHAAWLHSELSERIGGLPLTPKQASEFAQAALRSLFESTKR